MHPDEFTEQHEDAGYSHDVCNHLGVIL